MGMLQNVSDQEHASVHIDTSHWKDKEQVIYDFFAPFYTTQRKYFSKTVFFVQYYKWCWYLAVLVAVIAEVSVVLKASFLNISSHVQHSYLFDDIEKLLGKDKQGIADTPF